MSNPPSNQPMLDPIAHRLALPALLFLTALQPLHFIAGHLLFAIAPLAGLLGLEQVGAWGERLSDPDTIVSWQRRLIQAANEAVTPQETDAAGN